MKPQPPTPPEEAEELEEDAEEESEEFEDQEDAGHQPPPPSPLPPPAPPISEKPSFTSASEPNINQQMLNLVAKRLEMQAELVDQLIARQEKLYQQHQEDRQSLQSLTRDLATLSEMMQETIGTVDQHAERLTDATAALIRLHQESHPG